MRRPDKGRAIKCAKSNASCLSPLTPSDGVGEVVETFVDAAQWSELASGGGSLSSS